MVYLCDEEKIEVWPISLSNHSFFLKTYISLCFSKLILVPLRKIKVIMVVVRYNGNVMIMKNIKTAFFLIKSLCSLQILD